MAYCHCSSDPAKLSSAQTRSRVGGECLCGHVKTWVDREGHYCGRRIVSMVKPEHVHSQKRLFSLVRRTRCLIGWNKKRSCQRGLIQNEVKTGTVTRNHRRALLMPKGGEQPCSAESCMGSPPLTRRDTQLAGQGRSFLVVGRGSGCLLLALCIIHGVSQLTR